MIIVISLSLFFLAYGWLLQNNKQQKTPFGKLFKQPSLPFFILGGIGCTIAYFLCQKQIDSLVFIPFWNILLFFISGIGLLELLTLIKSNKSQFFIILAFCLLNTILLPQNFIVTDGTIPIWAERIILSLIWGLFAYFYFVLNGVEGILSIQSLSICLGLMLLFAIGVMPILYGFYSCLFIALFLALTFYTNYPALISLSTTDCRIFGFLIGWLGILATMEGNGSCFIILSMYYIYETVIGLCKKLNFKKQFRNIVNNTFYSQLADVGISPKNICNLVSRINLVMLLLAGFQIYAPNNYTIIIVAFFMVFWISSKVTSPEESNKHLLITGSLLSFLRKEKTKTKDSEK